MEPSADQPIDKLRAALLRGGAGVLALRVGAVFLAFAADLLLTRSLGIASYGHFSAGVSCLSLLITLGALGLGGALIKVIPSEGVRGHHDLARGIIQWSSRRMLAAGILLGALLGAAAYSLEGRIPATQRAVLLVLAWFLPLQVLSVHRQSVLLALKRPVLALLPEQVLRWLVVLVLLGVSLACGYRASAVDAAWMYGIGILVALAFAHAGQRRSLPREIRSGADRVQGNLWWCLALPMCWNTVMRMLNSRADPFLLGWLYDAEGAARFAVANRLSSLLLFGLMAAGVVVAPLIAERHAAGKRHELQAIATLAAKGLALYALPLAAILVAFGHPILRLFGPGFEQAYPTLCVLVAGRTLTCLVGCVGYLLSMTGHETQVAAAMTLGAVLKITLNFVLIPTQGEWGAALATLASLMVCSLWLVTAVRKKVGVDPTLWSAWGGKPA